MVTLFLFIQLVSLDSKCNVLKKQKDIVYLTLCSKIIFIFAPNYFQG